MLRFSLFVLTGILHVSGDAISESGLTSSEKPLRDPLIKRRRTQEDTIGLYLGSGCFWHVQYELIKEEKEILGRSASDYTAVVGYAGGSGPGTGGRVCYKYDQDDYAKLGHTEVVYLEIPKSKVREFAEAYWKLFVDIHGEPSIDRKDIVDVGADYRAAIGIPGGVDSPLLAEFDAAQKNITKVTMQLKAGAGSDPDTLGHPLVYVYDTSKFPFYMGELYHQFHDDFGGPYGSPPYPQTYNDLKKALLDRGIIAKTGCRSDGNGQGFQKVIPSPLNAAVSASSKPDDQSVGNAAVTSASSDPNEQVPDHGGSGEQDHGGSGSFSDSEPLTTSRAPQEAEPASSTVSSSLSTGILILVYFTTSKLREQY